MGRAADSLFPFWRRGGGGGGGGGAYVCLCCLAGGRAAVLSASAPFAHLCLSPLADERDRVQKKTFTKWVNKHLIKVSRLPVPSLSPPLSWMGQLRAKEGPSLLCKQFSWALTHTQFPSPALHRGPLPLCAGGGGRGGGEERLLCSAAGPGTGLPPLLGSPPPLCLQLLLLAPTPRWANGIYSFYDASCGALDG